MLKELSVKEALQLLADKYPKHVDGWFCEIDGKIVYGEPQEFKVKIKE
jgi:hypothetical protein